MLGTAPFEYIVVGSVYYRLLDDSLYWHDARLDKLEELIDSHKIFTQMYDGHLYLSVPDLVVTAKEW